jgi:hypothetical protein
MNDLKKSETKTNKLRFWIPVRISIEMEVSIDIDIDVDAEKLPNDGKRAELDMLKNAAKYIPKVKESCLKSEDVMLALRTTGEWAKQYKKNYPLNKVFVQILTSSEEIMKQEI